MPITPLVVTTTHFDPKVTSWQVKPNEIRLYGDRTRWLKVAELITDAAMRQTIDELVVRADAVQFADPDFREELGYGELEAEHTPRRPLEEVLKDTSHV